MEMCIGYVWMYVCVCVQVPSHSNVKFSDLAVLSML